MGTDSNKQDTEIRRGPPAVGFYPALPLPGTAWLPGPARPSPWLHMRSGQARFFTLGPSGGWAVCRLCHRARCVVSITLLIAVSHNEVIEGS